MAGGVWGGGHVGGCSGRPHAQIPPSQVRHSLQVTPRQAAHACQPPTPLPACFANFLHFLQTLFLPQTSQDRAKGREKEATGGTGSWQAGGTGRLGTRTHTLPYKAFLDILFSCFHFFSHFPISCLCLSPVSYFAGMQEDSLTGTYFSKVGRHILMLGGGTSPPPTWTNF